LGKRSDFKRIDKDFYRTIDPKAAKVLADWYGEYDLTRKKTFYEPCYGEGDLVFQLEKYSFKCSDASDITTGKDALTLTKEDIGDVNFIITNPPWSRNLLHPMIDHFRNLRDTWLLFDADWMHTKQAKPYLQNCSEILSVGRLKWIPDTKMTGKDNVCWYHFVPDDRMNYQTEFVSQ
jgi:hypothetical protein